MHVFKLFLLYIFSISFNIHCQNNREKDSKIKHSSFLKQVMGLDWFQNYKLYQWRCTMNECMISTYWSWWDVYKITEGNEPFLSSLHRTHPFYCPAFFVHVNSCTHICWRSQIDVTIYAYLSCSWQCPDTERCCKRHVTTQITAWQLNYRRHLQVIYFHRAQK